MSDITYKKFSELTRVDSLQTEDIIPIAQFVSGISYNSKSIALSTLYNQTSAALIAPFTTSIQTTVNSTLSSDKWNSTYSTVQTNSAAWGATVTDTLTAFTQGNTTSPQIVRFLSAGTTNNASVAIVATGTGATLAQVPNSGTSGGNNRGNYATDLQKNRTDPSQVASGVASVIVGGRDNKSVGGYSFVGGGESNTSTSNYSTIGGGSTNSVVGEYSIIGGGINNVIGDEYSTIGGGYYNNVDVGGSYSTIGGGYFNRVGGIYATVVGGNGNVARGGGSFASGVLCVADASYSTSMGYGASATNYGEFALGAGDFNVVGDNKSSTFLARTTTSASGSAVVYLDFPTSTQEITLPNSSTYAFTTTILGLSSQTDSSGIHSIIRGIAKCNASGVITLYGVSQVGTIYKQPNTATFNAGMSAAGNKLRIVVATPTASPTYWTARVQGEFIQF